MTHDPSDQASPPLVIGWRECISLPDLGLTNFAIKVDTGAKTTALHATEIETFDEGDQTWVRFQSPEVAGMAARVLTAPVHTKRAITNTSGMPETRIVIRTPMVLAGRKWKIDISLADRGNMRFPLILGRRALSRKNLLVHPAKSYLVSSKPTLEGSTT